MDEIYENPQVAKLTLLCFFHGSEHHAALSLCRYVVHIRICGGAACNKLALAAADLQHYRIVVSKYLRPSASAGTRFIYEKGGVGDVEIKQFLAKVINNTLSPIRERRKEFEKDISSIYRMLEENSKRASFEASKKLKQVRRHLSVDYFTDYKFIEKQQKAFNKEHRDEENLKAYLAKKK